MIVYAKQLADAAADMRARGLKAGRFEKEAVSFTPAQLETCARVLGEGPQPIANGIKADMPGFIDEDQQGGKAGLVLSVGILPSREWQIAPDGTVAACPCWSDKHEEPCPHAR